jgi:hypothetical protein
MAYENWILGQSMRSWSPSQQPYCHGYLFNYMMVKEKRDKFKNNNSLPVVVCFVMKFITTSGCSLLNHKW